MSLLWRCLLFLACIPSGGAVLLKVWGIAPMAWTGLLFLLCLPVLGLGYVLRPELRPSLRLGFWGGLLGTIAYDVVRIPFHLVGFRVFAPIETYGVWLLEAPHSTVWSEALGWLYHFSNGITFGLMYALWMGGRHWAWGLLWGVALESIVYSTPFAEIFHLRHNAPALAIAYGAHLAYGYPLGALVAAQDSADERISRLSAVSRWGLVLCVLFFCLSGIPGGLSRDQRVQVGRFGVEGIRLHPRWLRIASPGSIEIDNPGSEPVTLIQPSGQRQLEVPARSSRKWSFDRTGIYQVYVRTKDRSKSSFLIVEPVERL